MDNIQHLLSLSDPPRFSVGQTCSKSLVSSGSFSALQQSIAALNSSDGVVGRADRNSISSPAVFRTPSVTASFQGRPISKDPQISNSFLAEHLRTPDEPLNSDNSKTSSHPRHIVQCLPPLSVGLKQRYLPKFDRSIIPASLCVIIVTGIVFIFAIHYCYIHIDTHCCRSCWLQYHSAMPFLPYIMIVTLVHTLFTYLFLTLSDLIFLHPYCRCLLLVKNKA